MQVYGISFKRNKTHKVIRPLYQEFTVDNPLINFLSLLQGDLIKSTNFKI